MKRTIAVGLSFVLTTFGASRVASAEPDPEPEPESLPIASCEVRLPEVEQSHQRSKNYKLLFEIGTCSAETGDYVHAIGALQKYLQEGGAEVEPDRRTATETLLADLRPRIGRATVASEVVGLELRIDGSCAVDATTFEPTCSTDQRERVLAVNPGSRRLTVKHSGFRDIAHVLVVAAGEDVRVSLSAARFRDDSNPYRDSAWTAWAVTGGALVGGTIVGIRSAFDPNGFGSASGIATVAFGSVALIAAGFGTYFTVRASRWRPPPAVASAVDVLGRGYRF